eukprot:1183795-Prorocentrum_minimum.AAC.3
MSHTVAHTTLCPSKQRSTLVTVTAGKARTCKALRGPLRIRERNPTARRNLSCLMSADGKADRTKQRTLQDRVHQLCRNAAIFSTATAIATGSVSGRRRSLFNRWGGME